MSCAWFPAASVLFLFISMFSSQLIFAAEISGYATVTSDYVWRGATQSNGDPAVQLGGEIDFENGVYAGVWGSTVDIENGPDRQRDQELHLYLGYGQELSDRWALGAAVVSYSYPGQSGDIDYDYAEVMLSANFEDRVWFQYAFSPDLYDSGQESHNLEVYTEWPLGQYLLVGGGAGYYDVSRVSGRSYNYWEFGFTWPVDRFEIDLRYHDSSRWVPIVSSADRAGSRLALSLQVSF